MGFITKCLRSYYRKIKILVCPLNCRILWEIYAVRQIIVASIFWSRTVDENLVQRAAIIRVSHLVFRLLGDFSLVKLIYHYMWHQYDVRVFWERAGNNVHFVGHTHYKVRSLIDLIGNLLYNYLAHCNCYLQSLFNFGIVYKRNN